MYVRYWPRMPKYGQEGHQFTYLRALGGVPSVRVEVKDLSGIWGFVRVGIGWLGVCGIAAQGLAV